MDTLAAVSLSDAERCLCVCVMAVLSYSGSDVNVEWTTADAVLRA